MSVEHGVVSPNDLPLPSPDPRNVFGFLGLYILSTSQKADAFLTLFTCFCDWTRFWCQVERGHMERNKSTGIGVSHLLGPEKRFPSPEGLGISLCLCVAAHFWAPGCLELTTSLVGLWILVFFLTPPAPGCFSEASDSCCTHPIRHLQWRWVTETGWGMSDSTRIRTPRPLCFIVGKYS